MHLFPYAALLLLAWGAFAFGAEFTWAYAPLLVFSVVVAILGRFAGPATQQHKALIVAIAFAIGVVVLQTIPLPTSLVETLSPSHDVVDYRQLYATMTMRDAPAAFDPSAPRPLSIAPSRSWLGLAFISAYALLLIGTARGLSGVGSLQIARGIVILGLVAAFAEIIQKSSASSVIYGFFTPRQSFYQSAPFVNRNHTAGWLIMALSLALGHVAGSVAYGMRVKPEWRERILWLSSRRASEVVLTGVVIAVMAIAIVLTESRSGFLCLLLVTLLFGSFSLRRQGNWWRRGIAAAFFAFVLAAAVVMGGADAVGERFAEARLENVDGRLDVWRDTVRIIKDYPVTGTGFNTYGIAMLHYQQTQHGVVRYIEAHNDYLQLAAEGGLLLVIPVIVLVALLAREVRCRFRERQDDKRTYWLRVGSVCGLVAIAFQSIFDFTLQMPGAAVMFAMLAAIAIHHPHQPTASTK